ncbi:MAG: hypothetical protein C0403_16935 [Desulfobacterium sp.]|nr:hypothetical protein [Desulfobacterium sp.]
MKYYPVFSILFWTPAFAGVTVFDRFEISSVKKGFKKILIVSLVSHFMDLKEITLSLIVTIFNCLKRRKDYAGEK